MLPWASCSRGGLDSSLVCAIAARQSKKPIRTFAIGMSSDAIDLKYAREVADYLHSDHREILIDRNDVLSSSGGRGRRPGHLRHHHHPRQHGHVSRLQGHP